MGRLNFLRFIAFWFHFYRLSLVLNQGKKKPRKRKNCNKRKFFPWTRIFFLLSKFLHSITHSMFINVLHLLLLLLLMELRKELNESWKLNFVDLKVLLRFSSHDFNFPRAWITIAFSTSRACFDFLMMQKQMEKKNKKLLSFALRWLFSSFCCEHISYRKGWIF